MRNYPTLSGSDSVSEANIASTTNATTSAAAFAALASTLHATLAALATFALATAWPVLHQCDALAQSMDELVGEHAPLVYYRAVLAKVEGEEEW